MNKTWIDYNLIEILLRPVAWRPKPRAWHLLTCARCMDHTSWCLVLGAWRFVFGVSCLALKPQYNPDARMLNTSVSINLKLRRNGDVQLDKLDVDEWS